MFKRLTTFLFAAQAMVLLCLGADPAPATNSPPPTNRLTATGTNATTSTNATAVPLTEIPAQAESDSTALETIQAGLTTDKTADSVQEDLPTMTDEITAQLEENAGVLSRNRSLEVLHRLAGQWQEIQSQLSAWKHSLGRRAKQLADDNTHLTQLEKKWDVTSNTHTNMPEEVSQKVDALKREISSVRDDLGTQQGLILTLQTRVTEQDARVNQALNEIENTRQEIVGHLFVRDAVPIWSIELRTNTTELAHQSRYSLRRQWTALNTYAKRKISRFVLHGIVFVCLIALVLWARRKLRERSESEPGLKRATLVFDVPIATALVLALVASSWMYPQAPRLLWAMLGAAALIPATIVLRRLIPRRLFPVLDVLVAFYFFDQLRSVAAAPELLFRGLFLLQMLVGIVFLAWFVKSGRSREVDATRARWSKAFHVAVWIALIALLVALITNAVGYGSLSKLLGHAALTSAYLALILYAFVCIIEGLILSLLALHPLARLQIVRQHGAYIQTKIVQVIEWAAICLWVIYVLEALSLRAPVFQDVKGILTAQIIVGSIQFSLGKILLFVVTIWAAIVISRIVRFILEEEIYPRAQLAPGLHYSISRMVHYIILLAGFVLALLMLKFPLTQLTLLVSAIGVGLGFGLQNIINNFVSGIILLFERPVKVGDVIQMDSTEGVVAHIGIRASIVKTTAGPEIIVPNGNLISNPVTNWTFSRRQRQITIAVGVVPGVEAKRVMDILLEAAAKEPNLLKDPPAKALMTNFSNSALNFELRVWTDQINKWMEIRSNLSVAINSALLAQNITIK